MPSVEGIEDRILLKLRAMKEDEISKQVLVPMFEKMKLGCPRFLGGTTEKGIDVLYHELEAPFGLPRFTGIQMKKEDITAKAGGRASPSALEAQVNQAFERMVGLPDHAPGTRISSLLIATTGKITDGAKRELESGTHGSKRLGSPLRFLDGEQLSRLVRDHFLEEFAALTRMELPATLQRIVIQGLNPFTLGLAYAMAGNRELAIPPLIEAVQQVAFHLESAYLSQEPDAEGMLRAAQTAIAFDKDHYNHFWIAGYACFLLKRDAEAEEYLQTALASLEGDRSAQVQRGPGFQYRYAQALAMLVAIERRGGRDSSGHLKRLHEKLTYLREDLKFDVQALTPDKDHFIGDLIPDPTWEGTREGRVKIVKLGKARRTKGRKGGRRERKQ